MGYDRDDVLVHTSLEALCDELLGPHKGRGRSASWPCPEPSHGPQTGATPPVTIFRPRNGTERWHCHGCGAGGTAVDLVMRSEGTGFADALDRLGRRAGAPETHSGVERPRNTEHRPTAVATPSREPSPALETYVGACEAWLWGPNGRAMRRWLARRSLGEDVLHANRVGADPGPLALLREAGLPRGGAAAVFPLLDDAGRAVYAQARYLCPRTRKYDNPSATLVPAFPRFGEMRRPAPGHDAGVVLICEGIPDALSAVQAGWRAVAVLGAGLPDERLAAALADRFPDERLVLAFDADHRGRLGAGHLTQLLTAAGAGRRVAQLDLPDDAGDLNAWDQQQGEMFAQVLDDAVGTSVRSTAPPALTPEVDELLETLAYRHLISDEPDLAHDETTFWHEALSAWPAGVGPVVSATPPTSSAVSGLGERIGVPGNDSDWREGFLESTEEFLARWAAEGLEMPANDFGIDL